MVQIMLLIYDNEDDKVVCITDKFNSNEKRMKIVTKTKMLDESTYVPEFLEYMKTSHRPSIRERGSSKGRFSTSVGGQFSFTKIRSKTSRTPRTRWTPPGSASTRR